MPDTIKQEVELLHTGKFNSPVYGDFEVTEADLQEMVKEFTESKAEGRRAIDFDHKAIKGDTKAAGWIEKIWQDGDRLRGIVEWTGSGVEALQRKDYRFLSAEYVTNWKDKAQGAVTRTTKKLRGATLTNRPFQEALAPVTLSDDPNQERVVRCEPVLLHDLQVTPKMTYVETPQATTDTTQERDMPESIREVLALSETATEDEILGAVRSLQEKATKAPDLSGYVALSDHQALQSAFDAVKQSAEESAKTLKEMERDRFFSDFQDKFIPAERDHLVALYDANPDALKALLEARPRTSYTVALGHGASDGAARSVDTSGRRDEHRLGLHEAAQRILSEGKAKTYGDALILAEQMES